MQSELLLIGRDPAAIAHYLDRLERVANFIETRRDPEKNLFLAGPAGNLLAPSYAGWKKPDGAYGMAYLTGLSVTYIAALDRLIEIEKMAGDSDSAKLYSERRDAARKGLAAVTTEEGYFVRSLDPDGTLHGVYGAEKHGYFEASPNHDAICFRVADDAQAAKIYDKIAAIPGLRPNRFILPNCPGYDDMYEKPNSWLWQFGTWVNGGHWSTCEARMVMGYYRLGKYEDARASMKEVLKFAKIFRMDNPLVDFGAAVYQPKQPINLCYDTFGGPAAMIRGLFEYLYTAEGLTLIPHIPEGISRLEQRFPIRFGAKTLYLATVGSGPVSGVTINGAAWSQHNEKSVTLPDGQTPDRAAIVVYLGDAKPAPEDTVALQEEPDNIPAAGDGFWDLGGFIARCDDPATLPNASMARFGALYGELREAGLGQCYEAQHAKRVVDSVRAIHAREKLLDEGALDAIPKESRGAANRSYVETAQRLASGLETALQSYENSEDARRKQVWEIWAQTAR